MEDKKKLVGISRQEYLAAVRLCPTNPAFAGTYESWLETTLHEIQSVLTRSKKAATQKP